MRIFSFEQKTSIPSNLLHTFYTIKLYLFLMNFRPPIIYSNADFHRTRHTNYFRRTNIITHTVSSFVVDFTAIEWWIENDFFFGEFIFSFGQRKKNRSGLANPIYSLFIIMISFFFLFLFIQFWCTRTAFKWCSTLVGTGNIRFTGSIQCRCRSSYIRY